MSNLTVNGNVISESVVETIIELAVTEVEGIAAVGGDTSLNAMLKGLFALSPELDPLVIEVNDDGALYVGVHIEVFYGYSLPEVATNVRAAVAVAIESQLGAQVDAVDVFVDSLRKAE